MCRVDLGKTLIIWDEAPMMNRLAFEDVNRHLKDICDNENAFGGKLVISGEISDKYFQWLHMAVANPSLPLQFIGHPFGTIVVLCTYA